MLVRIRAQCSHFFASDPLILIVLTPIILLAEPSPLRFGFGSNDGTSKDYDYFIYAILPSSLNTNKQNENSGWLDQNTDCKVLEGGTKGPFGNAQMAIKTLGFRSHVDLGYGYWDLLIPL